MRTRRHLQSYAGWRREAPSAASGCCAAPSHRGVFSFHSAVSVMVSCCCSPQQGQCNRQSPLSSASSAGSAGHQGNRSLVSIELRCNRADMCRSLARLPLRLSIQALCCKWPATCPSCCPRGYAGRHVHLRMTRQPASLPSPGRESVGRSYAGPSLPAPPALPCLVWSAQH